MWARYTTNASLASSDGWNDKPPITIQRCAPIADRPMPGTNVSATSGRLTATSGSTARRTRRNGTEAAIAAISVPSTTHSTCRRKNRSGSSNTLSP